MSIEKDMIEAQREILNKTGRFQCAACNLPQSADQAGSVRIYRPERGDPEPGRNKAGLPNVAVYILCRECKNHPWTKVRLPVLQHLAKGGLFKLT